LKINIFELLKSKEQLKIALFLCHYSFVFNLKYTSMNKNKKSARTKIIIESFFVLFIATTPFLYKIHDYLPNEPDVTISFLGMTIGNNGFNSVGIFCWFLVSKLVPLFITLYWFLTSKDWWYHILLIPIVMYALHIFEVLSTDSSTVDAESIFWVLPFCMFIIPFVYLIRVKIYDKYVNGIDLEAMDAELKALKEKERLRNEGSTMKKVI